MSTPTIRDPVVFEGEIGAKGDPGRPYRKVRITVERGGKAHDFASTRPWLTQVSSNGTGGGF